MSLNNFPEEYRKMLAALQHAHKEISAITTPALDPLTFKIKTDLKRHISQLHAFSGTSPELSDKVDIKVRPATHFMGRRIRNDDGTPVSKPAAIAKTPNQVAAKELENKALNVYKEFPFMDNDLIKDTIDDITIRAVAKLAGLSVSEKKPKNAFTDEFIKIVKDAITMQHKKGAITLEKMDAEGNEIQGGDDSEEGNILKEINPLGVAVNGALEDIPGAADIPTVSPAPPTGNKTLNDLLAISNTAILEAYEDEELKDFARQAGMEVTDKTKVDSKFVTALKEAIKGK